MKRRSEIALLLDGTAISPDADQISRMRKHIERGIDWIEVLRLAIPHGVLPLLGRNLAVYAASSIPCTTLAELERFGKSAAERGRQQSVELAKLVSALSRDGFRVLPFKGPVLALAFYGDVGLRESHDLDLWIDPLQFDRAVEWFREMGYRPVHHVLGVPREMPSYKQRQEEFRSPDGSAVVEIKAHVERSPASLFDPPFEQVWDRRSHISLNGAEMAVIAAEDLLPCLAVHGSKHFWRRLNWIVDIAAVGSSRPAPDWGEVLSRATEWHCRRRLLTAVALAAEFYGIEVPVAIAGEVRRSSVCAAAAHIRDSLFEQKLHTFAGLRSDFIYSLRSSDSMSERLRYIGHSRHFVGRILRADENHMMLPMSVNVRRVYGAFAAVRNWLGRVS